MHGNYLSHKNVNVCHVLHPILLLKFFFVLLIVCYVIKPSIELLELMGVVRENGRASKYNPPSVRLFYIQFVIVQILGCLFTLHDYLFENCLHCFINIVVCLRHSSPHCLATLSWWAKKSTASNKGNIYMSWRKRISK